MIGSLIVGIDASRNRSGGAKAHIIGIISALEAAPPGIAEVHIWTYFELSAMLPTRNWLYVHTPKVLESSIIRQLFWQRYNLPKELYKNKIDILLSTDAGTVCRYSPSVVMSRDMLSFEQGEMGRYFFSKAWLRLLILRYVQISSLRKSAAGIFLTEYAQSVITQFTGKIDDSAVIFHGVSESFRAQPKIISQNQEIRFVYVSNADKYKHHCTVIEAFDRYSEVNSNVKLILVGAESGCESNNVYDSIKKAKHAKDKIKVTPFLPHDKVPAFLQSNDVFIFASSCENMPNTLIEAMASGLPIICSDRGPMPEVLGEGGVYFDPEDVDSLFKAIVSIAFDSEKMLKLSKKSFERSKEFSWQRCADETFEYIFKVGSKYVS